MASGVALKISHHDRVLIEERIRDSEHKLCNIEDSIQHKLSRYKLKETDLQEVQEESQHYLTWLNEWGHSTRDECTVWNSAQEVILQLEELKKLRSMMSNKLNTLSTLCRKAQALFSDILIQERDSAEKLLSTLQTKHNELSLFVEEKCHALEEIADEWREFSEKLEQLNILLKEKKTATETIDSVRLQSSDIDRQLDKCKSQIATVQNQIMRITEVRTKAASLKQYCSNEGKEEIDKVISDLSSQHEDLLQKLKQQENTLRDALSSRKKFEVDCQKIDRWCKETEMEWQQVLPLDTSLEISKEKLKVYKKRSMNVQDFHSFVVETKQLGESYLPSLCEDDKPVLQEKLSMLQNTFSRVHGQVQSQIDSLEDVITAHSHVQEQITNCEQWLHCLQTEIKEPNVSFDSRVKDAVLLEFFEGIANKLDGKQPTINELKTHIEKLRADGQCIQADDIVKLSDIFEVLKDQVQRHMETCKTVLTLRYTWTESMVEHESKIREYDDLINGEVTRGLPVFEHIVRHKAALEKLQYQDSDLIVAMERASQIGNQDNEDDHVAMTRRVDKLSSKVKALQKHLQEQLIQCEAIQRESENLNASVTDVVLWFEEKKDILANCQPLPLDANKLTSVSKKYQIISQKAAEKLQNIKVKFEMMSKQFEAIGESLPQELLEKMKQIQTLEESIVTTSVIKEKHLNDAQLARKRFENSLNQISEWLRGAEGLLDSGYDGLDYDTLESTLREFTDYFTEASLCHGEIEQMLELSQQMLPTLDTNDSTTVKQILKNINKKYSNFVATAQKKHAMLEQKVAQWKQFQNDMADLHGSMHISETEWMTAEKSTDTSPDAVEAHLELVKSFLENAKTSRANVDNLNDLARDLDRMGNSKSRTLINHLIGSVNHRCEQLIGQAEARVVSLEEIKGQWEDFMSVMSSVETQLQDSNAKMSAITPTSGTLTYIELCNRLSSLQEIAQHLKQIQSEVGCLQSSHLTLQKTLPTTEGTSFAQENYMELMERYDRLEKEVKEETLSVKEEVNTRERFYSGVDQIIAWMRETLSAVEKREPELGDVSDRLSGYRLYEQEITTQMERAKILEMSLGDKYSTEGTELPTEIQQKLSELQAIECLVRTAVKEKGQELLNIQEDREKYRAVLTSVVSWLQRTDMLLQEKIVSIPKAMDSHQELLLTFEDFKTNINHLRTKGEDIIKHSQDSDEKQMVQKTLADINRQWLSLQAQTTARSRELSEAADLLHAISDVANGVQEWVKQAETVVEVELVLMDNNNLRDHLNAHRKIHKNIDLNQDKLIALNAMVKQLEHVCESPDNIARVEELKQRVATIQTSADVRLTMLEDADKKIIDFEREVSELMKWLEQTRVRMTKRDISMDLHNQLAIQEVM